MKVFFQPFLFSREKIGKTLWKTQGFNQTSDDQIVDSLVDNNQVFVITHFPRASI